MGDGQHADAPARDGCGSDEDGFGGGIGRCGVDGDDGGSGGSAAAVVVVVGAGGVGSCCCWDGTELCSCLESVVVLSGCRFDCVGDSSGGCWIGAVAAAADRDGGFVVGGGDYYCFGGTWHNCCCCYYLSPP